MNKYLAVVVSFLMLLSVLVVTPGSYGFGQEGAEHRGRRFLLGLTQEQRDAVRAKITELREEGATPEEIHAAVGEMLKEYGVELPEHRGKGPGRMGFFANLTEEQREAIRAKITELREEGATPEEIHAAVGEMLEGYGIELPEHHRNGSEATLSFEEMSMGPKSLSQSYADPNPFDEETNIFYMLSARDEVQIRIYNTAGQLIRNLRKGIQEPGTHSAQWDGTYENGAAVPGGVYLYRIEVGDQAKTGRLVLLR